MNTSVFYHTVSKDLSLFPPPFLWHYRSNTIEAFSALQTLQSLIFRVLEDPPASAPNRK